MKQTTLFFVVAQLICVILLCGTLPAQQAVEEDVPKEIEKYRKIDDPKECTHTIIGHFIYKERRPHTVVEEERKKFKVWKWCWLYNPKTCLNEKVRYQVEEWRMVKVEKTTFKVEIKCAKLALPYSVVEHGTECDCPDLPNHLQTSSINRGDDDVITLADKGVQLSAPVNRSQGLELAASESAQRSRANTTAVAELTPVAPRSDLNAKEPRAKQLAAKGESQPIQGPAVTVASNDRPRASKFASKLDAAKTIQFDASGWVSVASVAKGSQSRRTVPASSTRVVQTVEHPAVFVNQPRPRVQQQRVTIVGQTHMFAPVYDIVPSSYILPATASAYYGR